MRKGFFGRQVLDKYFLERQCPYTKRHPIKMKTLYVTAGGLLGLFVVAVIFLGGESEKEKSSALIPDYSVRPSTITTNNAMAVSPVSGTGTANGANRGGPGNSFGSPLSGIGYGGGAGAGSMSGRNRSANQVIRRGEGGNDPGSRLPMGYGIPARLLNVVRSTDAATPVIAEVTEDVFSHGTLSIPANTRVIGSASYDDASRRIQLKFNTFVYPDGDQHGVQGMGLMTDGSAGLDGDYHSGGMKRQVGRFLGNFISGFADGMKDRAAVGQSGIPFEPGSIKNGVLNGVNLSAQDQAKSYSEDLSQTKPFMTLNAGQTFVIFLEHEYMP